jgi:autotransporter-associated beta strand protein
LWSNDANWSGGSPANDPTADLIFPPGSTNLNTTNDISGLSVASITFSAANYYVSGDAITLGQGGATVDSSVTGSDTVAVDVMLGSSQSWTVANRLGMLNVTGGIHGGNTSMLTEMGAGTLNLSGNSDYRGGTQLMSGILSLGSNNALGSSSGQLVLDGGTLEASSSVSLTQDFRVDGMDGGASIGGSNSLSFSGAGTLAGGSPLTISDSGLAVVTFRGVLGGVGGITKMGTGSLELDSTNTYSGPTTLNDGSLVVQGPLPLGSGQLTLHGGRLLDSPSGSQLANNFNVNADVTVSAFSGTNFVLSGTGTLMGGSLTVEGSTVFTGVLEGGGALKVATGASAALFGANTYYGGTIFSGAGAQILVGSDGALGTGAIDFMSSSGLLESLVPATLPNPMMIHQAATIGGTNDLNLTRPITVDAGVALTVSNSQGSISMVGNVGGGGGLVKTGAGQFVVSGDNSFTGGTTLGTSGTANLTVGSDTALGTGPLTINQGGVLQANTPVNLRNTVAGSGTIVGSNSITFSGSVSLAFGATLTVASSSASVVTTFVAAISGLGSLQVSEGTLVLSGNNSYSGQTTVSGLGAVLLGADNGIPSSSSLNLSSGAGFDLNGFNDMIGGLSGTGQVDLESGALIVGQGDVDASFSGVITGAGRLQKIGAGTLILTGPNTYQGGTILSQGVLDVGNDAALGSGSVTLAAGAMGASLNAIVPVSFTNDFSVVGAPAAIVGPITLAGPGMIEPGAVLLAGATFTGAISGSGSLRVDAGATAVLAAANTYTGRTTVMPGGLLRLGAANAIPSTSALAMMLSAAVDMNGWDDTIGSLAGDGGAQVSLHGATLTVGADGTTTTFQGTINGAGALVKTGNGSLTLAGADLFTGGTTLSSGTLAANNDLALGVGLLTLSDGTTLQVGANVSLANPFSINGAVTLTNVAGPFTLSGPGTLNPGSTLTAMTGFSQVTLTGQLSGPGNLTEQGQGTLALLGPNASLAGVIDLNGIGGRLQVGTDTALGTGPLMLDSGDLQAITPVTLANAVTVDGAAAFSGNNNLTFSGVVTVLNGGALTVHVVGTVSISGIVADDGIVLVSAGTTLELAGIGAASGSITVQGNLQIDGGAELSVMGSFTNFNGSTLTGGAFDILGTFQFTGANIVTNAATLILDGPDSAIIDENSNDALASLTVNTGHLTIENGSSEALAGFSMNIGTFTTVNDSAVAPAGDFTNRGMLVLGQSSLFTLGGNFTQENTGILEVHLAGDSQIGQLQINGQENLDGTLAVALDNGFQPSSDDQFRVVNGGPRMGSFSMIAQPPGWMVQPHYDGNGLTISLSR